MTAAVTRLTPPTRSSGPGRNRIQGALALELSPVPALPDTPELDRRSHSRVEQVSETEVRAWAARLAQAVVEVLAGRRPASQLVRWTAPAVQRDLDRRARVVARAMVSARRPGAALTPHERPQVRPQVRSVHVCRPDHQVAEVSVHVRYGPRSRAVAMRLERRQERWLCTALELG